MQTRSLGDSAVEVSTVALGCGALGDARLSEREAERLVLGALDLGVTLFDTARSYGLSEARLGRILSGRHAVRSTKGGYGVEGAADWSPEAISRGVDDALTRLQVERVDLFHLHSCPLEVLQRPELLDALERARTAGKLRLACYSGDNAELAWAVSCGRFGAVQASISLYDQSNLAALAGRRGLGVLAKRPLANATWRGTEPHDDAARAYRSRHQQLRLSPEGEWDDFAARFTAFSDGVSSILAGTTSLEHLTRIVRAVERGPLPHDVHDGVRHRFDRGSAGTWRAMT